MADTDKLKRLAEARVGFDVAVQSVKTAFDFISAASPEAILALIAENERLREEKRNMQAVFNDTVGECDKLSTERDEAVALLREAHEAYGAWTGKTCKQEQADDANAAFLARIDGDA